MKITECSLFTTLTLRGISIRELNLLEGLDLAVFGVCVNEGRDSLNFSCKLHIGDRRSIIKFINDLSRLYQAMRRVNLQVSAIDNGQDPAVFLTCMSKKDAEIVQGIVRHRCSSATMERDKEAKMWKISSPLGLCQSLPQGERKSLEEEVGELVDMLEHLLEYACRY